MTTNSLSFSELSDRDLLATVHRLASAERRATTRLIASLAELDARRLYLAEGYSSLFTYCIQALDLSEPFADGELPSSRTFSSDVERTIGTSRNCGFVRHIQSWCVSVPTILAGSELGPDRVEFSPKARCLVSIDATTARGIWDHGLRVLRPAISG